jgi:hypothetical protein
VWVVTFGGGTLRGSTAAVAGSLATTGALAAVAGAAGATGAAAGHGAAGTTATGARATGAGPAGLAATGAAAAAGHFGAATGGDVAATTGVLVMDSARTAAQPSSGRRSHHLVSVFSAWGTSQPPSSSLTVGSHLASPRRSG